MHKANKTTVSTLSHFLINPKPKDQVWIKPPNCGPLVFHRDSTYFDFEPSDVITVWISFDDLLGEEGKKKGPLEYVARSHLWSQKRGSANQFFSSNYKSLVEKAAKEEGLHPKDLQFTTVSIPAGGCSVHNGKTWHGSGPNVSPDGFRRGMGLHFVPSNAKFSENKKIGKLWIKYKSEASNDLPDDLMPVTFTNQKIVEN